MILVNSVPWEGYLKSVGCLVLGDKNLDDQLSFTEALGGEGLTSEGLTSDTLRIGPFKN